MTAWRLGMGWVLGMGLAAAVGCGGDSVVFGVGGAGGGSAGAGGTGGDGGSTTTTSANGGSGAGGDCTTNEECAVDSLCEEGLCDNGSCVVNPLPAGTDCGDNATCDGNGNCLVANGAPCGEGSECASGQCVDGLCCDSACDGTCQACNVAGLEGICSPQEPGTDPDMECGGGVCDGGMGCVSGAHILSDSVGGSGTQTARDVAVDSQGNIIVVGDFFQTMAFGNINLTSAGQSDVFVAKFDAAGTLLWANSYGNFSTQNCWTVAVDGSDNIVIGGNFAGSIDFGAGTLNSSGSFDVFVAKLDPNGMAMWSNGYGDGFPQELRSVAIASNGDIAVGGYFEGLLNFGAGVMGSAGDYDAYVAKLDANGATLFSQRYGDVADQRVYGVAFDTADNLLVTGRHIGSIDLGGGALTSAGDRDVFIAKLSPSGGHLWSNGYGDEDTQLAWDIATDAANNAVVVGYNDGSVDFGGGAIATNGGIDIFMVKVDASGNHLYSAGYGGGGTQQPRTVAIDGAGHIVMAGYINGSTDFGGGMLQSNGQEDAFIAKFTAEGQHLWSRSAGGGGVELIYGAATDSNNRIYLAGSHSSAIDLGGGPLASVSGTDAFFGQLEP